MRIAVINLKGGTGKTVTAVHLATALAARGRTLLVDADPQGSALSWSEEAEELPFAVVGLPVRSLHKRLSDLLPGLMHVVIDTPPGDHAIVRSAITAAEVIVVPIAPSIIDLDRLRPTLDLIAEVEAVSPLRVFVLLTRVRAATRSGRLAREILEDSGVGSIPSGDNPYQVVLDELVARELVA
jgi:chromosome partitioning protein